MESIVNLICPSCGATIKALPGNYQFKCEYCGREYIYRDPNSIKGISAFRPRLPIPVPEGVRLEKEGCKLRIVRQWFSWKSVPLALFCIAWDAFLIFWYGIVFSTKAPWIMAVFPIAHLGVGIGLTYFALANFFNHTTLEVTPQDLSIWHDPLPWPGETKLHTSELTQFFCKQVNRSSNNSMPTYQLYVINRQGRTVKLLSSLETPDLALFIEQQLEHWMKITDVPEPGELPRD